jgi:hypothetical protein
MTPSPRAFIEYPIGDSSSSKKSRKRCSEPVHLAENDRPVLAQQPQHPAERVDLCAFDVDHHD